MIQLVSAPIIEQLHHGIHQDVGLLLSEDITPHLAVVQVDNLVESDRYIRIKTNVAKELGITVSHYQTTAPLAAAELPDVLSFLATDEETHGTILQLPLPRSLSADDFIQRIAPLQDVDALAGRWMQKPAVGLAEYQTKEYSGTSLPPMLLAVLSLLVHYSIHPAQHHTVLVGAGRLVGQPIYHYFQSQGWSVDMVDEETENIIERVQKGSLVITGTGVADLVTYQWLQEGAIVLNAARDVHIDSVSQIASAMSPETGGLGPLTVSWLLYNTVQNARRSLV